MAQSARQHARLARFYGYVFGGSAISTVLLVLLMPAFMFGLSATIGAALFFGLFMLGIAGIAGTGLKAGYHSNKAAYAPVEWQEIKPLPSVREMQTVLSTSSTANVTAAELPVPTTTPVAPVDGLSQSR